MAGTDPMRADEAIWDRLELGPNTRSFFKRVYADGLDKYTRRLRALGFAEGERGLDAGCGLGQWSFALAGMCNEVWCVDVSQERIDACVRISTRMKKTNVRFVHGVLESLPFKSASFDRVLCYSVLYQTHYEKSLQEFARVTRKGGLIYLSTNDIGRFLQHIIQRPNPTSDFDPRADGLATIWNTLIWQETWLLSGNWR